MPALTWPSSVLPQAADFANGMGASLGANPGTPRSRGGRQGPSNTRGFAPPKPSVVSRNPAAGPLGPASRKGVNSRVPGNAAPPAGGGIGGVRAVAAAAAVGVAAAGNPAARGRGRIGRGLSEAAEALLGMGGEKVEDEGLVGPSS